MYFILFKNASITHEYFMFKNLMIAIFLIDMSFFGSTL